MKKVSLKTSVLLSVIGFILGFLSHILFFSGTDKKSSQTQVQISPEQLRDQSESIDINFQKQLETLTDQNLELQQQLEVSQGLLTQAKLGAKKSEKKISSLIKEKKRGDKESLSFSGIDEVIRQNEYLLQPPAAPICDSLINEVVHYTRENQRKDSLYEAQLVQFDSIVTTKDQLLGTSLKAFKDIHLLLGQSLSNQKLLQKENLALKHDYKRQRIKSKLVTAGLMIFSGFAASYILRH